MSNDQTIIHIHAFLSGQMTTGERAQFQAWLKESEENQDLFDEIEQAWTLASSYKAPSFDISSARAAMPFISTDTNENITVEPAAKPRRLGWVRWSAAAAIAVLIAASLWLIGPFDNSTLVAAGDEIEIIELEDGSIVHLKSDGVVYYPEHFGTKSRNVILDGEAYFDIARDESRKFTIETDHAMVTVLGTEFGVDEHENGVLEVHVAEGKVRIEPFDSDVFLELIEGQSAYFDSRSGELKREQSSNLNEIAWHTRRLAFKNARLTDVVSTLEDVYKVKIDIESEDLTSCTLNSNYSDTPLETILSDMSHIWGCKVIQTENKSYTLRGGNCN